MGIEIVTVGYFEPVRWVGGLCHSPRRGEEIVQPPNGSRFSCGALKKDAFPNPHAPPRLKRLLGGMLRVGGEICNKSLQQIEVLPAAFVNRHQLAVEMKGVDWLDDLGWRGPRRSGNRHRS